MFEKLTDFSYKRTRKQAVGFYIAYLVVVMLVAVISTTVAVLVTGLDGVELGVRVGVLDAILATLVLSFTIIVKKGLTDNFGLILVALSSALLAYFAGGLVGLIPTAYLTTK